MKKLLLIIASLALISSCEKEDKENNCPVVSAAEVPTEVITTFEAKYPNTTVTTWFNKDNASYCALMTENGKEIRAYFDNNGNFQNEEIDQQGEFEDNDEQGCDCDNDDADHNEHHGH